MGPNDLHRQLRIDALLRGAAITAVAVMVVMLVLSPQERHDSAATVLLILCGALWLGLSLVTARTAKQLAQIHESTSGDPDETEKLLTNLMRRWPLHRSVRLHLYYRLSALHHRGGRFDRSVPLMQALLARHPGPPREARAHLLLMLVEAALYGGNMQDAYEGLIALNRLPLNLNERLERLTLQVHYEIAIGRDDLPIEAIAPTLELVELLPPPLCGALHVTLWGAAERCGHNALAQWLLSRARLLCTEEQIHRIAGGQWIPKVAERLG